jgi:adenine-specific DNA-methyltransferase
LWSSSERSIIEKIENRLKFRLSDVCESFQGIITGSDRAFVVDSTVIEKYGIEKQLLKRWIKGSCVKKYRVDISSLYIIYSDMIDDISNFDGAISYIQNYRDRLEKRRECIKGIRQWYQLQWGRKSSLFDMTKIIFPYKSSSNRFAVDTGSYSSADVYGMYIKNRYKDKLSNEFLCGILNSRLYEFYFKSFAKKLGEDLYDYYPNTVMRLMVPCIDDTYIKEMAEYIIKRGEQGKAQDIMDDIDKYLYDIFELTLSEIEMVEKGLKL